MPNRLQHYLHGTRHMEGAWPEGTPVNEYGDPIRSDAPTTSFAHDLGAATKGIPHEIAQWWRDAHTRTPWLHAYEERNMGAEGGRPMFFDCDTVALNSYHDYRAWRYLGMASDAILMLIVVAIVLMFFA